MDFKFDDTIYAPATSVGAGAISIIRVSGPQAISICSGLVKLSHGTLSDAAGYTLHYGSIFAGDGQVLDDVVVSVFRAPRSYTGEDSIEISCHASSYIVSSIMQLLAEAGARAAEPGEFTRRAFVNGKMDLAQAEAVADVISSSSAASHRVAFNQLRGGFSSELQAMRGNLLDITSLMELELDFSEEDVEFADRTNLIALVDSSLAQINKLASSFRLGNAIKNGVPVAIVGAANAGKSTLLNALLSEERAIVTDIPGTTRDTVEETYVLDGILFRFIDTAGIRETSETVEKIGIDRSFAAAERADVVILMVDSTSSIEAVKESVSALSSHLDPASQSVIIAANKSDIADSPAGLDALLPGAQILSISARSGEGLDALRAALVSSQSSRLSDAGETLVSNARHYNSLCAASRALSLVRGGLLSGAATDLVAQDLREALYHLGTITGEISTDEVLGNIFKKFCIGK
ncbi:MAG: tRNA uridine-5-carboxymethylaminomethyl(34) synthesis GTPase MnmE [Bacteroidales bacterium]|nr:tRNA uridine-5-carboxymethylaminomethyl(34) synthesis GTPase MnmE [Bacteroidales bacterium]